jgi:hypothetical protein
LLALLALLFSRPGSATSACNFNALSRSGDPTPAARALSDDDCHSILTARTHLRPRDLALPACGAAIEFPQAVDASCGATLAETAAFWIVWLTEV